jgi:diguanylate cyclase (GGDEF)-like protein
MLGIDPRSFIVISTFLGLLCAFLCFVLRSSFPRTIQGIRGWGTACLVLVVSSVLFATRGQVDIFLSSYVANILVVTGIAMMHRSLRKFTGQANRYRQEAVTVLSVAILLVWPTFMHDDYRLRIVIVSAANAGLFGASAFVISRMSAKSFVEYFTLSVFLITAVVSVTRCGVAILSPGTAQPLTDTSSVQYVYLATFSFSILALSLGFIMMINRKLQLQLEAAALHDGLTGIFTRTAFFDSANMELARSQRSGNTVALLMIDIDDFKLINDRFGHLHGDRALVDFVKKTRQVLRSHDLFGRYGGEEFVALLPATDQKQAHDVARRICEICQQASQDGATAFTVSIGVATIQPNGEDVSTVLAQADAALYRAKLNGKNRYESHCVFSATA